LFHGWEINQDVKKTKQMETVNAETTKNKKPAMLWLGFGTLVLGTLAFFGIKHFKKPKNENTNDNTTEKTNDLDSEMPVQDPAYHKPRAGLPSAGNDDAFPLRLHSKGDKVRSLQQALIQKYGAGILAKHGADGEFGTELNSALQSKGYGIPLQESDFLKITAEKKEEESKKTSASLLSFDPAVIAKGIYFALTIKDFNTGIILLKGIKNKTDYALVSEQIKNYRIGGVRQTLVNALLNVFTESSQRSKIQNTLKNIGLKYDGNKWTLS
jgi:peptidoglycan hydrolase-like protein with peptidoglycan-binding domain